MVFELAEGGDLFKFLCEAPGQRLDEDEGRALFRQVHCALRHGTELYCTVTTGTFSRAQASERFFRASLWRA